MEEILNRLEAWRVERGLDKSQGFEFDLDSQVSFLFEEMGVEFLRGKTEESRIDALCDTVVFSVNGCSLISDENILSSLCISYVSEKDILQDIFSLLDEPCEHSYMLIVGKCKRMIRNMGYNFTKCMKETLKEIESRKGAFNPDSGKWEKFTDDESMKLWYKADYSSCKIV